MNKLEMKGSYIATVNKNEYILIVKGVAPMLRITHAFNLTLFLETGTMENSVEIISVIEENPLDVNYKPLDITTIVSLQSIPPKIGNIEYSETEYQKWKKTANNVKKEILISNIMLEKGFTYHQSELICNKLYPQNSATMI